MFSSLFGNKLNCNNDVTYTKINITPKTRLSDNILNKNNKKVSRPPSVFIKPNSTNNDVNEFIDTSEGSEMARTDITREIKI